jgi:hypothetical protein
MYLETTHRPMEIVEPYKENGTLEIVETIEPWR